MDILSRIAEEKIKEAQKKGVFNNLAGAGKPLDPDVDQNIPREIRMAYRLLKNAGYIPPELEERKEIVSLKNLINTIDDEKEKKEKIKELNFKVLKFNMSRKRALDLDLFPEYEEKVSMKLLK